MVSSRMATALAGLIASLGISIAAWVLFDTLLLFLLVPVVPLLLRHQGEDPPVAAKRCPVCGFETQEPPFAHCPHDGTRLE